jgi:hypothetical protein
MSSRGRLCAAFTWILGVTAIFLVAGAGSRGVADRRAGIVSFNRSLGARAGIVENRLGLLREELHWLESTGRHAAAVRTRADIDVIERARHAP